jgi:hypothetical protein
MGMCEEGYTPAAVLTGLNPVPIEMAGWTPGQVCTLLLTDLQLGSSPYALDAPRP